MNKLVKKLKKIDYIGYIFLIPAVIVLGLFLVYPIIWTFLVSFKDIKIADMMNTGLFQIPGEFIMFDNYKSVIHNELFIKSIHNTLAFGVIYMPLVIGLSLFFAIMLNRRMKGVNFFRTVLFIPYIISVVSASLIFMFLFNGQTGLVNAVISAVTGHDGPSWLASTVLAMPVIAIMCVWKKLGYFMLIYLAGLQNISKDLYEAADIDGANNKQKFTLLTWPLLSRITFVIIVMSLIDVLKVFQEVYVMTGGGPVNSTVTVPFLIYNEAFTYHRFGTAAAMSYILFFAVVVITILQRVIMNRNNR